MNSEAQLPEQKVNTKKLFWGNYINNMISKKVQENSSQKRLNHSSHSDYLQTASDVRPVRKPINQMKIVSESLPPSSIEEICNDYKENLMKEMQLLQSQVQRDNPENKTKEQDTAEVEDLSSDDDDNDEASRRLSEHTETPQNYDHFHEDRYSNENHQLVAMNNDLTKRNEILEKTNQELEQRMGEMLQRLKNLEDMQQMRHLSSLENAHNELKTPKERKQINPYIAKYMQWNEDQSACEVKLNTSESQQSIRDKLTQFQQRNKENLGGNTENCGSQNEMIINEVPALQKLLIQIEETLHPEAIQGAKSLSFEGLINELQVIKRDSQLTTELLEFRAAIARFLKLEPTTTSNKTILEKLKSSTGQLTDAAVFEQNANNSTNNKQMFYDQFKRLFKISDSEVAHKLSYLYRQQADFDNFKNVTSRLLNIDTSLSSELFLQLITDVLQKIQLQTTRY